MNDADDSQLQIKKRARRRLVGAIAFAAFVALALPFVMLDEPQMPEQDVEIRIPDPNTAESLPLLPAAPPAIPPAPSEPAAPETVSAPPSSMTGNAPPARNAPPAQATPPAATPAPNPAAEAEARRAAAILSGQMSGETTTVASAAADTPHVIQIGAFSDAANVENLKKKLGELKIPVYTEALDSPQGAKTRVRAGPFKNRAAADAALVRMRRIGVDGRIAPQP
ncbi:MAG: SPOR domain-containing protein [Zoogloeaceae bacterium]|jgi:DedD protein|nr:SPOR domain-containing protein [Zoogloeaceae bacterium]